jgi:hypothetical protein
LLDNLTKCYNETKEILNPKKKFAFSKKITTSKEKPTVQTATTHSVNFMTSEYIIKDKKDEKIEVTDIENRDNLIIENLENCEIVIPFDFKALYAQNLKNCTFYLGCISGGSHLTSCTGCEFFLATHQLRIHKTYDTIFTIISASSPIIEDCSGLKFKLLSDDYMKDESLIQAKIDKNKNKWNTVLDFKWHKKDKSPNFDIEL